MEDPSSAPADSETPADDVVQTDAAVENQKTLEELVDGSLERCIELVQKGKLLEKLEELQPGSEISIDESNGRKTVRIKAKGTGLHASYLHGDSIASALAPPEQA